VGAQVPGERSLSLGTPGLHDASPLGLEPSSKSIFRRIWIASLGQAAKSSDEAMDKLHIRYLTIAALIIIGLWLVTPFILFKVFPAPSDRGTFGDLYGSINSLFSGLALLGVIAAIFLQHKELSLSTIELRKSAQSLKQQVELAAMTARIQALPTLIQAQKQRIKVLGGRGYEDFSESDYSLSVLERKISELNHIIINSPQAAEEIQTQWKIDPYNKAYFGFGTREQALERALQAHENTVEVTSRLVQQFELLATYIKDFETLYQTIRETSALSD
jgi:hypothetical protein